MSNEAKLDESITVRMTRALKDELQAYATGAGQGVSFAIRAAIIAADVSIVGEAPDLVDSG
jgi:hypothetical protein